MTKKQTEDRDEAITKLRDWIKPGDTVYTILDHVSASGMSRAIRVVLPVARPACSSIHLPAEWKTEIDFLHPNYAVGIALGLRHWKRHGVIQDGLILTGCGMDMGFALVYDLSRVLFPAGFGCIGVGCPSNDHANGDRDYTPHYDGTPRHAAEVGQSLIPHSHYHTDGGYALRHRWL